MISHTYYRLDTGEIAYLISTEDENYEDIDQPPEGMGRIRGQYDAATQYIQGGKAVYRPELNLLYPETFIADGGSEWVCEGAPEGCVVHWPDGYHTTIKPGQSDIRFSTDQPSSYRFVFDCFPYKMKEVFVEAVSP